MNKRHFSGSNSSLPNSDDDDDFMDNDGGSADPKSKEERRRLSHTAAEQKRRNAIKVSHESCESPLTTIASFNDPVLIIILCFLVFVLLLLPLSMFLLTLI